MGRRVTILPLSLAFLPAAILTFGASPPPSAGLNSAEEQLQRVGIAVQDVFSEAWSLERAGYDVLRRGEDSLELVVTPTELEMLVRRGYGVSAFARDGGVPEGYPDLDTVYATLAQAEADHPDICQVVDLTARYATPSTYEGRSLFALRISDNVVIDEDEPAVLIVSAHHCRELVTPVIALNAIATLTSGYGVDPEITAAIDAHEIWIAPVWNPDGYAHVFDVEPLWRKNRRVFETAVGVDLNRNYPFGWSSACSGSMDPVSNTYKGPEPGSEAETRTMMAWSLDRQFAKVIDYHTPGREALWGYACLPPHPFDGFLQAEAVALSVASGYLGDERNPSADGEHFQWQLGSRGAHAFLIETHSGFQPEYKSAEAEAAIVFPGILAMLDRPIPISGHVTDAVTGSPVTAEVALANVTFTNGEKNHSGGPFGRFHVFAPAGLYAVAVTAEGYLGQAHAVTVVEGVPSTLEVRLTPVESVGDANRDGIVDFADVLELLSSWGPCPPGPDPCPGDFDGNGAIDFGDVLLTLANWS